MGWPETMHEPKWAKWGSLPEIFYDPLLLRSYRVRKPHMTRYKLSGWHIPAWLWGLGILALTSYPRLEMPDIGFSFVDKVGHFTVYFIFGFLITLALTKGDLGRARKALLKVIVMGFLFAVLDEFHQKFIPGRSADILDAGADMVGIFLSQILFLFVKVKMKDDVR
jgi:VanZ family protein